MYKDYPHDEPQSNKTFIKIRGELYRVMVMVAGIPLDQPDDLNAKPIMKGKVKIAERRPEDCYFGDDWFDETIYRLQDGSYVSVGSGGCNTIFADLDDDNEPVEGKCVFILGDWDDAREYMNCMHGETTYTASASEWMRLALV